MSAYIPLAEMMSRRATAERVICRRASEAISLARMRGDVARNADRLKRRVAQGAGILLTCSDSYWFVVGLWSALHAGARVILPPNVQAGTVDEFRCRADLTIHDPDWPGAADGFICEAGGQSEPLDALSPDDCHLDFFTSGSTGAPKCIPKTLQQLEVEVRNLETLWGRDIGAGLVLMTVSHLHVYGLTFGVLWPMVAGRPFDANIHRIWETLIARIEAESTIVSSPAHLSRIPDGLADQFQPRPRTVLSAGAPLPWSAAQRAFETFGCWPREIYGSTETGGVAYRDRAEPDPFWTPFPGVETRAGPSGLLRIKSAYVPNAGWHELDDRVEFESGQTFRLKERADRVAKIEGTRVALAEIEARITALTEFDEAAAVVIDGPSPIIGVAAVLTETGARQRAELGSFRFGRRINAKLRRYLEPATLPRRWRYIDRIPTNEQGKRVSRAIMDLFEMKSTPKRTAPEVRNIRQSVDTLEIDMLIPRDLLYFQGHFPDLPVLPGIVQLDWAVAEARRHFGQSGAVSDVQNLKYRRLIRPDSEVTLSLRRRPEDGRVSFEYHDADAVYSSGRIGFAAA